MPNFKEFIKGFEEKPEQPKPQEVKAEQPQPKEQPKPVEQPQRGRMVYYQGKEMPFEEAKARSMGSYSIPKGYKPSEKEKKYMEKAAEYEVEEDDAFARWDHETDPDKKAELRKNMDNLGKEANAFLRELDKEPIDQPNPQPKQGSFEQVFGNMEEEPKAEEPKEDIYTINPQWANVEYDEDYERSYGEGANADDIEFEMSENPEIYEGKTRHQIVAALSNRLNTHPDKIRELLGKPQQEAKPREGSFQQAFGGEEEQEQDERAELFQKYLDMGYDKGDAQFKVQEVLNRRENAKKEEEFEKLASVGRVFADNGEITINTPWSKNRRNNYKNYLELRSYLDENYGQGNYAIDYLQDETRDNGRETSAKLKVRLY